MHVECVDYLECVERYVWSHVLFVLFRPYRHYIQLKIQTRREADHSVKPSGVMANSKEAFKHSVGMIGCLNT